MPLEDIPANLAQATEEGINDAIDAFVTSPGRAKKLAEVLEEDPRAAIKRALRLNRYQRAALTEMSDDRVRELVAPVREALMGPNAMNFRVLYREQVET